MKRQSLIWIVLFWSTVITASFIWNYFNIRSNINEIVLNKSRSFFEQIVVTRSWNASHGGVYVPVNATTQPNPYLKDSLRDIVTINGMELTKINPAFMTRQIGEINSNEHDLKFHITSLNPIRPQNKADYWELKALSSFENGNPEILELVTTDNLNQYRYMAPLITENGCLKCHAEQGYKLGDIRGGISVSFPAQVYKTAIRQQSTSMLIVHLLVLFVGLAGIIVFYSLSRKYYLAIENKNVLLTESVATKNRLFSIIAHDLRSPFSGILQLVDLLTNDYDKLEDKERKEFLSMINKSSNRTFELLENLLTWARNQLDNIKLEPKKQKLRNLVDSACSPNLVNLHNKNIRLEIDVQPGLNVYVDEFTIKTTITNLFNNAIKYTNDGGLIKISAFDSDSEKITVNISDTGVGIPEEVIDKLFNIETENYTTRGTQNEKGTGLGLIVCKEFVEKNNGRIWLESEVGKGSTFSFEIPKFR